MKLNLTRLHKQQDAVGAYIWAWLLSAREVCYVYERYVGSAGVLYI